MKCDPKRKREGYDGDLRDTYIVGPINLPLDNPYGANEKSRYLLHQTYPAIHRFPKFLIMQRYL